MVKKKYRNFFRWILIIIVISFLVLLFTPAFGQESVLEQPLPGIETPQATNIGAWFLYIFRFALYIVGAVALLALVYAGVLYILSGANVGWRTEAKDRITAVILGVLILLFSYVILDTVNPRLINLNNLKFPTLPDPEAIPLTQLELEEIETEQAELTESGPAQDFNDIPGWQEVDDKAQFMLANGIVVPVENRSGLRIVAGNKNLTPTARDKLYKTGEYADSLGYQIIVSSAWRTYQDQVRLWNKYGQNPARVARPDPSYGAPHQTGGAIDIKIVDKNGNKVSQSVQDDIMFTIGWVRYQAEGWHYEYGTKRWSRGFNNQRGSAVP